MVTYPQLPWFPNERPSSRSFAQEEAIAIRRQENANATQGLLHQTGVAILEIEVTVAMQKT